MDVGDALHRAQSTGHFDWAHSTGHSTEVPGGSAQRSVPSGGLFCFLLLQPPGTLPRAHSTGHTSPGTLHRAHSSNILHRAHAIGDAPLGTFSRPHSTRHVPPGIIPSGTLPGSFADLGPTCRWGMISDRFVSGCTISTCFKQQKPRAREDPQAAPKYERKILGRRVGRRRDFSRVLRYFETNEIIHTNWYGPQFMMFGIR